MCELDLRNHLLKHRKMNSNKETMIIAKEFINQIKAETFNEESSDQIETFLKHYKFDENLKRYFLRFEE
jgi:hypothetical protein